MEDPKQFTKYKLSRKLEEEEVQPAKPEQEPKKSLTLGTPHSEGTYIPAGEGQGNDVEDFLEEAYSTDRENTQRQRSRQKAKLVGVVLGLVIASVLLLLGYSHALQQWPVLEPRTWYLPFVLSVLLSLYLLIRSYVFLKDSRSVVLFAFGIVAALAIAIWNAEVLRVTAQDDEYSPSNALWLPDNTHEMLIAFEMNRVRGLGATVQPYQSVTVDQYKKLFRAIPRSEWEVYFRIYLEPAELEKVNLVNVDDTMVRVCGRMQEARVAAWNEFQELYNNPTLGFRLVKLGVSPYKLILSYL